MGEAPGGPCPAPSPLSGRCHLLDVPSLGSGVTWGQFSFTVSFSGWPSSLGAVYGQGGRGSELDVRPPHPLQTELAKEGARAHPEVCANTGGGPGPAQKATGPSPALSVLASPGRGPRPGSGSATSPQATVPEPSLANPIDLLEKKFYALRGRMRADFRGDFPQAQAR